MTQGRFNKKETKDLNNLIKCYLTLNKGSIKMVLKTFSVQEAVYSKFSHFCKSHGMSMSKQVEMFMESLVEKDPEAKREYLEKLERIRKGKFVNVSNFADRYDL